MNSSHAELPRGNVDTCRKTPPRNESHTAVPAELRWRSTVRRQPDGNRWDGRHHGACRWFGASLFFDADGETYGERIRRERTAKSICLSCPVLAECRGHAVQYGELHGVWGGSTPHDRAVARR
ncbi:WhiB family transcriptional regulator [Rhodococcus sp. MEB032]|uniref:WhiB family transcriptional regulator n=1 Tax=Rhodococcus sp. MEB032 TaxID=3040322 RepID=UPI00254B79D0|nr:WhiB family transcriptional regulator [Rhodococcus sp. MEB032]